MHRLVLKVAASRSGMLRADYDLQSRSMCLCHSRRLPSVNFVKGLDS
jgi:hypothetical protein